jgi:Kef-type K+ transport system membrane component KefB
VETFAQFGVVFLLFALGLEFSLPKVLENCMANGFGLMLYTFLVFFS